MWYILEHTQVYILSKISNLNNPTYIWRRHNLWQNRKIYGSETIIWGAVFSEGGTSHAVVLSRNAGRKFERERVMDFFLFTRRCSLWETLRFTGIMNSLWFYRCWKWKRGVGNLTYFKESWCEFLRFLRVGSTKFHHFLTKWIPGKKF